MRDAAAGRLEDVLLGAIAADDRARGQTGSGGDVAVVDGRALGQPDGAL